MKRSLAILTLFLVTAMLSGCIISKTPSTDEVSMTFGDQMTFSVMAFPSGGTYTWTLDGEPLSNTESSYVYTALAGKHFLTVRAKQLFGTDTQTWTILSNSPPIARTGPDQSVPEGTVVTLDGSNSTDPDGDIVSYEWVQTGGTPVTLSNPTGVTTTFQAPDVDQDGDALTFQLTVKDSTELTSTAPCIVNVTWSNEPPTAISGPNQTVPEGTVVVLDGTGSTDPDDGIASYEWTQIDGPTVELTNADTAQPSFTAPDVDPTGAALTFRLTVTDHGGLKSTATCIVNVTWVNVPPVANAGPDQTVSEVTLVTLNASGSTDSDDGIATYDWQQTQGPAVTLSDAAAMQPTFTAPNVTEAGAVLVFQLTVTDNGGLKSTATCTVTVTGVNDPPISNAGPDKTILERRLVTLNGGSSTDPDDGIVSYQWQQTDGPSVTLNDADSAIATFTALVDPESTLTFELTVTDAGGLTSVDSCTIEVVQSNTASKVAAGGNFTVAIKSDGSLWAWGGDNIYVPTQFGTATDWVTIAAGTYNGLAIKSDGSLWYMDGVNAPLRIGTDTDWITSSGGQGGHFLAIKADGSLWAWGANDWAQLGDGTTINRSVPTRIGTDTDWLTVTAAFESSYAIKTDGSLWAWGHNNVGQLGDGTTIIARTVPTRIGTDTNWVTIDSAEYGTKAMKADGTVWSWGNCLNVPTQIGTATDWVTLSVGNSHTIAIKADGSLWAWGLNDYGQLGDGTRIGKDYPTRIGSDNDWITVLAGSYHSGAIKADGSLWMWGQNYSGQLGDGTYGNLADKLVPTMIGTGYDW